MFLLVFLLVYLVASNLYPTVAERPSEEDRVSMWYDRGNVWPPTWQEESDGMKRLMQHREHELMTGIRGGDERWENWLQLTQSRLVPKFTERGFDILDTPPAIHAKLREAVMNGVENWDNLPIEGKIDVIYHPEGNTPKFVPLKGLQAEVMNELKSIHEQWAGGIKLVPKSAYGVRLYLNGSSLVMHHDKVQTHVISSIVHIAHEYDDDDEPWPIEIEDHDGNLHSVSLEPGKMLFYESAKCLHGRMQTFKGKYYGSIFIHYAPEDLSIWDYTVDKVIENVPPHWRDGIISTEGKGSRWCGAAVSVDSRCAEGAPHRTFNGKVEHYTLPHNYEKVQPPPPPAHPVTDERPKDYPNIIEIENEL